MNETHEPTPESAQAPELSSAQLQMALETLRSDQNLPGAVLFGALAALAGAAVWGVVSALTHFQIGWMAIGVGALVGVAVRYAGKGIDPLFGVIGAVFALLGCMLGNLLTMIYFIADKEQVSVAEVGSQMSFALAGNIMGSTFQVMDLVFYGIALYCGYRYAFRHLTRQDLGIPAEKAT